MTAMNKEGGSACVTAAPDSPSPVPLPPGKPALPGADGTPFGCPPGRKEKPTDPVEWTVMDVVVFPRPTTPRPSPLTPSFWGTGEVKDLGSSSSFPFCLSTVPPGCIAF
ncbi:rCG51591, isoform CRA_a [Rattus norvegicus]|uniref:RCG51591, isoform CRA_a n=1 Tax=Rattus norvegicus TaxID=10116 RepID=A6IYC1_RAT|nr:rCG51591, isoform CRA_a [Rattus norvegicus]